MVHKQIATVENIQSPPPNSHGDLLAFGIDVANAKVVRLSSGESLLLDATTSRLWIELLESDEFGSEPFYFEYEERTGIISELLTPTTDQIRSIETEAERKVLWFNKRPSPAFVLAQNPEHDKVLFDAMRAVEHARDVCIFIDPKSDEVFAILDVKKNRTFTLFDTANLLAVAAVTATVTQAQAEEIFQHVAAWICPTVPTDDLDCVPFNFPTDCCYARAHKICNYISSLNISCGKVWNYGNLCVPTVNHPDGKVRWRYHVTAFIRVGAIETAIDPSMFNGPVAIAQWITGQNDAQSVQERTNWQVYTRSQGGAFETIDPDLSRTNLQLKVHINSLRRLHDGHPGGWAQNNC